MKVKEKVKLLFEKLKAHRKPLLTIALIVIFMSSSVKSVAAEDFTDKISNGISSLFNSIIDGIKSVFSTIFKIITWPFRTFDSAMLYTWDWSREHFGPLGVVLVIGIGGLALYEVIFWIMRYKDQLLNN